MKQEIKEREIGGGKVVHPVKETKDEYKNRTFCCCDSMTRNIFFHIHKMKKIVNIEVSIRSFFPKQILVSLVICGRYDSYAVWTKCMVEIW